MPTPLGARVKIPLNALLHPAARDLASLLGCPNVAPGPTPLAGEDACTAESRAGMPSMNVTMRFAVDPWNAVLTNPVLLGSYVIAIAIFAATIVVSWMSLGQMPKFNAAHVPAHCVACSVALQNSRLSVSKKSPPGHVVVTTTPPTQHTPPCVLPAQTALTFAERTTIALFN